MDSKSTAHTARPRAASPAATPAAWLALVLALLATILVHAVANGQYGYHRDELLHLAAGQHPAWGYLEFPPLIGWIAGLQSWLLGDSLQAARVAPTLAMLGVLALAWRLVGRLGGGAVARALTLLALLAAPAFWRTGTLLQPVIFDHFFWLLGALLLAEGLSSEDARPWLALGLVAGLALLTKYTVLLWIGALLLALVVEPAFPLPRLRRLLPALCVCLVIVSPNVAWQMEHGFPALEHFARLRETQLAGNGPLGFLLDTLIGLDPFTAPLWLLGLGGLLFARRLRRYRPLGIAAGTVLLLLPAIGGKAYYAYPLASLFFAAGGVLVEGALVRRFARPALAIYALGIALSGLFMLPFGAPLLPLEKIAEMMRLEPDADGRVRGLPDDYAAMLGWPELVQTVEATLAELPADERDSALVWGRHYAQAGALLRLAPEQPSPVCYHGSFWLWARRDGDPAICVAAGFESVESLEPYYDDVREARSVFNRYAQDDDEATVRIFVCRGPKQPLAARRDLFRGRVFE